MLLYTLIMGQEFERYIVGFTVGLFLLFIGSMLFNYQNCDCDSDEEFVGSRNDAQHIYKHRIYK